MTELLPCPFCGCEPTFSFPSGGYPEILCTNCYQAGTTLAHSTEAEAIEAWNTRTFKAVYEDGNLCRIVTDTDTYIPERTCHITSEEYDDLLDFFTTHFSCGHYGIGMARWFKHCPECGARVVD